MLTTPQNVSLRLFGSPGLFVGDTALNIGRRARGMVGYLAMVRPHRASRERMTGFFWPDRGDAQARASLRQCLVELRAAMGDSLAADREWVSLEGDAIDSDLHVLERALAGQDAAELAPALAAIGAEPLLDGLEFGEAFDDWLRGCRAAHEARFAAGVLRHIETARAAGDITAALAVADAWLVRDPRDEAVAAAAIACEMARNAVAAARKRLRTFEDELARDGDGPAGPALRAAIDYAPAATLAGITSSAVALATSAEFALPHKPSIAVLPFADLTSGVVQDVFADGMVEEISIVLSRFSSLFVIAGQSSLTYRSTIKTSQQIGRELGVRYLLEGSVRKAGDKVRISVKVIEAATGEQIWAERFDGDVFDVFDLQDRVANAVASAIDSTITDAEMRRAEARPATHADAYDLTMRASALLNQYSRASIEAGRDAAERAFEIDPRYGWAASVAAFCHGALRVNHWTDDLEATAARARALGEAAVQLSPDDQTVLVNTAGMLMNIGGNLAEARDLVERAIAINPEHVHSVFWGGWVDVETGNPSRGLERFEKALRLNPRSVYRPFQLSGMGNCLFFLGRFDEAAIVQAEAIRVRPGYVPAHAVRVASLARAGRRDEALTAWAEFQALGGPEMGLWFFRSADQRKQLRAAFALLADDTVRPVRRDTVTTE
ncbi:hypothetical protein GCM10011529_06440 [Polymorphobacter glacialis]|uniref:Bacterial transcriptional activator domain-containing protein n=1 Tax=Sandarakinorhabdus glacialis TaxID=1614636 RepID=A0A916ZKY1_9SPHN|nr:hypothetical protein [Polymorphobacter glacialis]GGE02673.1 hypothetical protein GCM10011529_06440 [Polymorphobacter glacialis]